MAKFVMMSMVFTVVLLKSAAIPFPRVFTVGDGTGWAVPKETDFYKDWADKNQFTVGDTVTFPHSDVKRVHKVEDYEACDESNAIDDLPTDTNGQVNVPLNSTGNYYFISPDPSNCTHGMKLAISVSDSSPAVSVGVLVPMIAVVMGFFF